MPDRLRVLECDERAAVSKTVARFALRDALALGVRIEVPMATRFLEEEEQLALLKRSSAFSRLGPPSFRSSNAIVDEVGSHARQAANLQWCGGLENRRTRSASQVVPGPFGRVEMDDLEIFADSLAPDDHVVIESTSCPPAGSCGGLFSQVLGLCAGAGLVEVAFLRL